MEDWRTTHGMSKTRTYASWVSMKARCSNPNDPKWPIYGGARVSVCPEWMTFKGFYADMGDRPEGTSIDRKLGAKVYCKENCRWATPAEQNNNLSSNVSISFNGETMNMADWARKQGLNFWTLRLRLKRGWTIKRALTEWSTCGT